jgi:beta-1,4-mannosyl-glycoprotein beta-1,4-N-acetylglucosaminyltransferase
MIIDCFSYFNEKELLELRLNLLHDHVDKFVITEGSHTHKGVKKGYEVKEIIEQLGLPQEKVHVIHVDMPDYEAEKNPWVRERMQRDAAAQHIEEGDIAFFGDCDEIINPDYIEYYSSIVKNNPNGILRVPLAYLSSSAKYRVHNPYGNPINWRAPFMCMKHHLDKYTPSQIRESHALEMNNIEFPDLLAYDNGVVEDAGWHFSWMGDSNRLKVKEESFLHWDEVKVLSNYHPTENGLDVLGRKDHILKAYDLRNLPGKLFELDRVRDFLIPNSELSVVQLGTNKANDDLSDLILKNYSKLKFGLFVEANPMHKKDIEKCYSRYKNAIIETIGIKKSSDDESETLTFYVNSNDGPDYEIASTKIEHIFKHMQTVSHLVGGTIETFEVPCISLEQLLDKHNVKELDLLAIDLEGMDGEVLLNLDLQKYNIKKIEFEQLHLGETRDRVESHLLKNGYSRVNAMHEFNYAFRKIR